MGQNRSNNLNNILNTKDSKVDYQHLMQQRATQNAANIPTNRSNSGYKRQGTDLESTVYNGSKIDTSKARHLGSSRIGVRKPDVVES